MKNFAKLYEYDDIGQVLVMFDTDDNGNPAIKLHFKPCGLGLCCLTASFEDNDRGWEGAEYTFDVYDSDMAYKGALSALPEEIREALS